MNKTTIGIGALVLVLLAFFGGYKYATAKSIGAPIQARGQFAQGLQGGARGGRFGAGATFGQIVSKDDQSITVSLQSGGSRVVFLSASTTISKMSAGSAADLVVGQGVAVTGTQNSDGSVTASSVDLRPMPAPGK